MILGALEFPPISHLLDWPDIWFVDTWYGINKVALIMMASLIITLVLFGIAGKQRKLVPTGVQNIVEVSVEFIRDNIVMQTMGSAGVPWIPLLTAMFWFILFCNLFEIIPGIQMPAPARIALPLFLAILVWFCYNAVGMVKQGPFTYFKNSIIPPGVPKALLPLVALIEFVSTFLVRPFSLAVRLFANMMAGHLLLVTFALMCAALLESSLGFKLITPLPFVALVALVGFELLVAFLQAYIFTILTAVYISSSAHAEH